MCYKGGLCSHENSASYCTEDFTHSLLGPSLRCPLLDFESCSEGRNRWLADAQISEDPATPPALCQKHRGLHQHSKDQGCAVIG